MVAWSFAFAVQKKTPKVVPTEQRSIKVEKKRKRRKEQANKKRLEGKKVEKKFEKKLIARQPTNANPLAPCRPSPENTFL